MPIVVTVAVEEPAPTGMENGRGGRLGSPARANALLSIQRSRRPGSSSISAGLVKKMVKQIRNKDGRLEKYSKAKIMHSMMVLGVDKKTARTIVKTIRFHKGMTTREVRREVGRALKKIDVILSARYFTTVDLKMDETVSGVEGYCLMSPDTMKTLKVKVGENVEAYSGWNKKKLRAYPIKDEHYVRNSIYISDHDLGFLHVNGNEIVAVRKATA